MMMTCFFWLACEVLSTSSAAPHDGDVWLTQNNIAAANLKTIVVRDNEIAESVTTQGRITFDDLFVAHVFSPVTGRVVKVVAQLGARVKKGETLAMLDSADVSAATDEVDRAHTKLVAAEQALIQQKTAYDAQLASAADLETAEEDVARAHAELERAKQKAGLLKPRDLRPGTPSYALRSPLDGEIIARGITPGMEVRGQYAGGGTAVELFTIGELDTVWAVGDILAADLARVQTGQRVGLTAAACPGEAFRGALAWVSSARDPNTGTAKVRCIIKNPDHTLKPQMFATITIRVAGSRGPVVPRSSLFEVGGKPFIFVQTNDVVAGKRRFARRPVVVGAAVPDDRVEILQGVQAGEIVVTTGAAALTAP